MSSQPTEYNSEKKFYLFFSIFVTPMLLQNFEKSVENAFSKYRLQTLK